MTIRVRRVTEEDCARLPAFRESMEGGAFLAAWRDEAFYRHKYLVAGLACVAERDGEFLGLTGATRKTIRMAEDVLPSAEMGDLFVHPDLRGKGVFRRVHDAVLGELRNEGVRYVTVRPGRTAGKALREAFGYRILYRVAECVAALTDEGRRTLPLGGVPVVRRFLPRALRRDPPAMDGFTVEEVDPGEIDGPEPFAHGWPVAGTIRDRERMRMRYAEDPAPYKGIVLRRGGEVAGAAIHAVYEGKGFIVDGWLPGGVSAGAAVLARAILDALARDGAGVVHFWRSRELRRGLDPLATALRAEGLRMLRGNKWVLGRPLDELRTPPTARSWIFRMGDTDGI